MDCNAFCRSAIKNHGLTKSNLAHRLNACALLEAASPRTCTSRDKDIDCLASNTSWTKLDDCWFESFHGNTLSRTINYFEDFSENPYNINGMVSSFKQAKNSNLFLFVSHWHYGTTSNNFTPTPRNRLYSLTGFYIFWCNSHLLDMPISKEGKIKKPDFCSLALQEYFLPEKVSL